MRKWDRRGDFAYLPIQSDEGTRLLAEVPEALRLDSWHFVVPADTADPAHLSVYSAGDAFGPLLRRLPRGRRLAMLSELSPGLTNRAYRLVAGNRTPLGKLVRRFGTVPLA